MTLIEGVSVPTSTFVLNIFLLLYIFTYIRISNGKLNIAIVVF